MSSSAPTSQVSSGAVIGNAPAFWAALASIGVAWYLAPKGLRPLMVWFVAIVLVALVLLSWPTIAGNIETVFGTTKPGPTVVARTRPVPA